MATVQTGKATDFITFSRASLATVTDRDGKIKWAGHNLLTNSESFDASAWTKGNTTVTANNTAAPNGTTTADALMETAATGFHSVGITSLTSVQGATYTLGAFIKANGRTFAQLNIYNVNTTTSQLAVFNLSTGAVSSTSGGASGTITSVGSGWYLCTVTATTGATVNTLDLYVSIRSDASTDNYAGDITKGIYIWGAHLYRSDLGGMVANTSAYPMYNPTTPKNLLGYTEDFDNAAWSKITSTVTANAIAAPNGSLSADKVVVNSGSGGRVHQAFTLTGNYVFSVYAKAGEWSWITLSQGSADGVWFNLNTGVVGTQSAGYTGSIVSVGDGWYRCSMAFAGAGISQSYRIWPTNADSAYSTGDGVSGIYLWGAQLSDSASLDSYSPVYGAAVTSAAYYGPRRDYDPVTLSAKGLLVEEARTNFRTYSSDFTQSSVWTPKASTTVNSTTLLTAAPSGAVTAQAIVPASNGGTNGIADETGLYSTGRVFSFYAKAGSGITVIAGQDGAGNTWTINLSTGAGTFAAAYTYNSVTPVANGWYRVAMNTTGTGTNFYIGANAGADGTNYFYLWGVQLEAGAFATSYIPTGASTVTRSADVASVSTQAFPYSSTAGSWVVSARALTAQSGTARYAIANTTGNVFVLYTNNGDTNIRSFDGANVLSAAVSNFATVNKFASAYGSGSKDLCVNGGAVATGTYNGNWSSPDRLFIGSLDSGGSGSFFGHIRQITYIPRRLSNSELQARTA